jgi:hypothetical protein
MWEYLNDDILKLVAVCFIIMVVSYCIDKEGTDG